MSILKFLINKKPLLIVDMISLLKFQGMKNDFSPRAQLQVLRKLSKFSLKENLKIIAVLSGEPLHKAPKGKKFDNIKVHYSSSLTNHSKKIASLAILKNGILVTNDEIAETKVKNRIETMKTSTFRKAFDPINDFDKFENYDPKRKKRFKKYDDSRKNLAARSSEKSEDADAISELIDLV